MIRRTTGQVGLDEGLTSRLTAGLQLIKVLARRLYLDTGGVRATPQMLRGVWGAALHDLNHDTYRTVFSPREPGDRAGSPRYLLRRARAHCEAEPTIEFLLFGAAIECDATLSRAWDIASGMGLGPRRRRFFIRLTEGLGPDGSPCPAGEIAAWDLSQTRWPLAGPPGRTPCRLAFPHSVRLLRQNRLLPRPTLADVVVATCRRVEEFLPYEARREWSEVKAEALEQARKIPSRPWRGRREDLVRYSGRQRREVCLHGVVGYIDLPAGPGALWPLLAGGRWLHVGKSTAIGLGQLVIEPIPARVPLVTTGGASSGGRTPQAPRGGDTGELTRSGPLASYVAGHRAVAMT
jgi:hypothetical protein